MAFFFNPPLNLQDLEVLTIVTEGQTDDGCLLEINENS